MNIQNITKIKERNDVMEITLSNEITKNFRENLSALMKKENLTQYKLAQITGSKKNDVKSWVMGDRLPNLSELKAICDALVIIPEELLEFDLNLDTRKLNEGDILKYFLYCSFTPIDKFLKYTGMSLTRLKGIFNDTNILYEEDRDSVKKCLDIDDYGFNVICPVNKMHSSDVAFKINFSVNLRRMMNSKKITTEKLHDLSGVGYDDIKRMLECDGSQAYIDKIANALNIKTSLLLQDNFKSMDENNTVGYFIQKKLVENKINPYVFSEKYGFDYMEFKNCLSSISLMNEEMASKVCNILNINMQKYLEICKVSKTIDNTDDYIGLNIRYYAALREMTSVDIALKLKKDYKEVDNWIKGTKKPTKKDLNAIAEVLVIDPSQLLDNIDLNTVLEKEKEFSLGIMNKINPRMDRRKEHVITNRELSGMKKPKSDEIITKKSSKTPVIKLTNEFVKLDNKKDTPENNAGNIHKDRIAYCKKLLKQADNYEIEYHDIDKMMADKFSISSRYAMEYRRLIETGTDEVINAVIDGSVNLRNAYKIANKYTKKVQADKLKEIVFKENINIDNNVDITIEEVNIESPDKQKDEDLQTSKDIAKKEDSIKSDNKEETSKQEKTEYIQESFNLQDNDIHDINEDVQEATEDNAQEVLDDTQDVQEVVAESQEKIDVDEVTSMPKEKETILNNKISAFDDTFKGISLTKDGINELNNILDVFANISKERQMLLLRMLSGITNKVLSDNDSFFNTDFLLTDSALSNYLMQMYLINFYLGMNDIEKDMAYKTIMTYK